MMAFVLIQLGRARPISISSPEGGGVINFKPKKIIQRMPLMPIGTAHEISDPTVLPAADWTRFMPDNGIGIRWSHSRCLKDRPVKD